MLNGKIKEVIEQNRVGSVATVSPDGRPCVSPKGTFIIRDEATLVFGNLRSPDTVRNLAANPAVEVCFLDIFHRTGCRVADNARYFEKGSDTFETNHPEFAKRCESLAHLIQGYVVIDVDEAKYVTSPVYDIGKKSDDLARHWLGLYTKLLG